MRRRDPPSLSLSRSLSFGFKNRTTRREIADGLREVGAIAWLPIWNYSGSAKERREMGRERVDDAKGESRRQRVRGLSAAEGRTIVMYNVAGRWEDIPARRTMPMPFRGLTLFYCFSSSCRFFLPPLFFSFYSTYVCNWILFYLVLISVFKKIRKYCNVVEKKISFEKSREYCWSIICVLICRSIPRSQVRGRISLSGAAATRNQ